MDVAVVPADPTVTCIGVGDQTFDVVGGYARVPLGLASGFLSFPRRYTVRPLPLEGAAPVALPAVPTSDTPASAGAEGATGSDDPTGAASDTGSTGDAKGTGTRGKK